MPGGVAPANRLHCSGPPTQPVVVKKCVLACPTLNVCGVGGPMTQAPEGGGGVVGGGVTATGVQPDSVEMTIGLTPSETMTLQSLATKPVAWMRNLPSTTRPPARLVEDCAVTKPERALEPSTRSSPPFS